jgi:DNA-binding transcriptional regulator YiaG
MPPKQSKPMTSRQVTHLREAMGLNKLQFAALIEVSRETVSAIEHGKKKVSRFVDAQIRATRQRGKIPDSAWLKVFPEN